MTHYTAATNENNSISKNTTVHGPAYFVDGHTFKRLLWLGIFVTMITLAGFLIAESVEEWRLNPVLITFGLKAIPIEEVSVSGVSVGTVED